MPDRPDRDTARLLSRLRFRHLQLIVELGRERSLRSAAATFAVTQPALSRTLGEIEAAFGFPLFVRSARGVVPTPEGEVAIRGAGLLLEEIDHVRVEAAQGSQARALIRIGAPPFIAQGCLPPCIARLGTLRPPVRVQLIEGAVPALREALLQGQLDAIVTTLKGMGEQGWESDLRYVPLFVAEYTPITHKRDPLRQRRRVAWAELAAQPWILPPRTSRGYRMLEEQFVRAGRAMPLPVVEVASPVTAVRMAAAGVGVAVVPVLTLAYLRGRGDVSRIDAWPPMPSDEVGLISRGAADNPRLEPLRTALLDEFGGA